MGVFSGAGGVLVIVALIVLVGLAVIIGLTVVMQRRDFSRRTQDAHAWAAAGFGIPQSAVDRAMAAPDLEPYPADEPRTAAKRSADRS
jgi:hypothetical protein